MKRCNRIWFNSNRFSIRIRSTLYEYKLRTISILHHVGTLKIHYRQVPVHFIMDIKLLEEAIENIIQKNSKSDVY